MGQWLSASVLDNDVLLSVREILLIRPFGAKIVPKATSHANFLSCPEILAFVCQKTFLTQRRLYIRLMISTVAYFALQVW